MIQIDMEMPKCCDECFVLDENGDYPMCLITHRSRGYNFRTREIRMPDCPLKDVEPRVMTLEEVEEWCAIHPHKQSPLWVEFRHGNGTDGWRVGLVNSGLLAWCKDGEARCWTSRPTEERREATPWN